MYSSRVHSGVLVYTALMLFSSDYRVPHNRPISCNKYEQVEGQAPTQLLLYLQVRVQAGCTAGKH